MDSNQGIPLYAFFFCEYVVVLGGGGKQQIIIVLEPFVEAFSERRVILQGPELPPRR